MAGLVLFVRAQTMPFYSDPDAPARLHKELMGNIPRTEASEGGLQELRARLEQYETPKRRLSDAGRCLVAMAAGLWVFRIIWERIRSQSGLMAVWMGLWLLLIPFSWWAERLREDRTAFLHWDDDSRRLHLMVEYAVWPLAGGVTLLILLPLMWGRQSPGQAAIWKPTGAWSWIRAVFLWWAIARLVWIVGNSVSFGEEGPVISGIGAVAVLLRILSLPPHTSGQLDPRGDKPLSGAA